MNGAQAMEIGNANELRDHKDEEQIFYEFIDTLKEQINKLKTNKLILSDLNKRKVEIHQTQWEEYDKLLELQRNISEERVKNVQLRDEIMYLDQAINLKEKVLADQDMDLLQTTDKISNATSNYLNALDVKLKFKQKNVLNSKTINFEVIVNTTEVCLAYDLVSEQYSLISLKPTHPKFNDIQTFLTKSGDVSGLLASVYLWTTSAKMKNHNLNS